VAKKGKDKEKERLKKREAKKKNKNKEKEGKTRPSRPIRCDVWIVERMRYRPTDRQTDTASYRGALSHLKTHG